jgi:hypothetical protein
LNSYRQIVNCQLRLTLAALALLSLPAALLLSARGATVFAPSKTIQIGARFSPKALVAGKPATVIVMIVSPRGKLVNGAEVTADVGMTDMDMGTSHPAFKAVGMGQYSAAVNFSMGGPWSVKVHVKTSDGEKADKAFAVKVADQP